MLSVVDFYGVVFAIILMTGLIFTFPVFLVLLVRFGIISVQVVTKNRRYIYAGLFVITALITPDGGPIADAALFIPIIVLLEISILVAKRYEREGAPVKLPWFEPEARCRFCGGGILRMPPGGVNTGAGIAPRPPENYRQVRSVLSASLSAASTSLAVAVVSPMASLARRRRRSLW